MIQNNQKTLIDKLNIIIKTFINNDAKLWNIGTDIYKSWSILLEKISNHESTNNDFFEIRTIKNNKSNDIKYSLFFLGENVTPSKVKNSVSKSAMRQYLQIGSCLGFVDFKEKDNIETNNDNKGFAIRPSLFKCDNLTDQIINVLYSSVSTLIRFKKNFCFTLFMSLIQEWNENIFYKLDYHRITQISKRGPMMKYSNISINDKNFVKYLKYVKGETVDIIECKGKSTYITTINKIKEQTKNFNLFMNKLIDILYSKCVDIFTEMYDEFNEYDFSINNEINFLNSEEKEKYFYMKNIFEYIKNNRGKLRINIQEKRVRSLENLIYTDLDDSKYNEKYVSYMDACHIYDVKYVIDDIRKIVNQYPISKIKNDIIIKNKIDELINTLTDYNNGIFLDRSCHKLFDSRDVWFDENGKLKWFSEVENIVKNIFGEDYLNASIKSNVLTKKMKEYLFRRSIKY